MNYFAIILLVPCICMVKFWFNLILPPFPLFFCRSPFSTFFFFHREFIKWTEPKGQSRKTRYKEDRELNTKSKRKDYSGPQPKPQTRKRHIAPRVFRGRDTC